MNSIIPFKSGGGEFVTRFVSGALSVSSGVSGDFITITPPAGQKVKLNWLTGVETGISVALDGVNIITLLTLTSGSPTSAPNFFIGSDGTANATGTHRFIIGGVDEVLTVNKVAATTGTVRYSYEFGE